MNGHAVAGLAVLLLIVTSAAGCGQDGEQELADDACSVMREATDVFEAEGLTPREPPSEAEVEAATRGLSDEPSDDGLFSEAEIAALDLVLGNPPLAYDEMAVRKTLAKTESELRTLDLKQVADGLDWERFQAKTELTCSDEKEFYEYVRSHAKD